jgi:hypothetical protein
MKMKLIIRREIYSEFDARMAPVLLNYGKALFELGFSQQGVMGKEEVEKNAEGMFFSLLRSWPSSTRLYTRYRYKWVNSDVQSNRMKMMDQSETNSHSQNPLSRQRRMAMHRMKVRVRREKERVRTKEEKAREKEKEEMNLKTIIMPLGKYLMLPGRSISRYWRRMGVKMEKG